MTWVVAAATAAGHMAKFWQNLSRDGNSSLSVLSVKGVVGTFPPKKRGWTGYVEKDTARSSLDRAENIAAIAASIALISIAAASRQECTTENFSIPTSVDGLGELFVKINGDDVDFDFFEWEAEHDAEAGGILGIP
ncbi:hypothetical protein QYF36_007434 [Acer negundo]|nr:hypothetical protein QYF36_007434 [Acer negundo]